ncbi:PREDICTED: caffeic acid 3-O-methyltransferase-like [Lupinus angustifolius]|nr:PREDICTED: caffeic acid 3-O-methyltransferase-like [Lupinus angustifolius]
MEKMNGVTNIKESQSKARLVIFEIAHMISVPMSLTTVIKLKVPDAIWQNGLNIPLSASQILTRLRPHGGGDAENLQRILRLLVCYDIFTEHLSSCGERKYSLAYVGKTLVADEEGLSYAAYILHHHQDALMRAWPLVGKTVEDPTIEPFKKANGEGAISYYTKRPETLDLTHKALAGISVPLMRDILDSYNGFHGIETLVDVGGSSGVTLQLIMQKYPNVRKGINFDLPDMVACAPNIPGVIHVGGDALESVPCGDAIFMKWVLLAWTDDECLKAMQNCYKALPVGGKLIACDPVLPELTNESQRTKALLGGDIFIMTMYRTKGKHRTEQQFKELGISAGFPHFRAVYVDPYMPILEFQK